MKKLILAAALGASLSSAAHATAFTETSPTNGGLPAGVTRVGGIVLDLTGANNVRVVSQLAASLLFVGSPGAGQYPLLIGTQTGFDAATIAALGGGLLSASVRVTLYDGDTAPGNFDFNDNGFTLNGVSFGNWSGVQTQVTSSDGTTGGALSSGFGDDTLATGWFSNSNAVTLASFFSTLATGKVEYRMTDTDPGDQFLDFTQGLSGSVINVGQGPVVSPPAGAVPEAATWMMMIFGFGMAGAAMRYQRRSTKVTFA